MLATEIQYMSDTVSGEAGNPGDVLASEDGAKALSVEAPKKKTKLPPPFLDQEEKNAQRRQPKETSTQKYQCGNP